MLTRRSPVHLVMIKDGKDHSRCIHVADLPNVVYFPLPSVLVGSQFSSVKFIYCSPGLIVRLTFSEQQRA